MEDQADDQSAVIAIGNTKNRYINSHCRLLEDRQSVYAVLSYTRKVKSGETGLEALEKS